MKDPELDARVAVLRREGRFEEAASACLEAGEPARAAELFAAVWDWPRAIEAAEQAGRLDLAYGHALEADDRDARVRLVEALRAAPEQAERAAEAAERKGRREDAAQLREVAGDLDAAAALYERAGEHFEAARCHEAAGRWREAGMLYERRVAEAAWDGEAALRLGRILAHLGRWEPAARALQKAAEDPERIGGALRLSVACFAALGMEHAAADCLDRLRHDDPSLPLTVPEFLEESFGDERGLVGLAEQGDGETARMLAGRYRILRALGAGATGRVLLAQDAFYDREVAIKVLTVGGGSVGRDAYARFAREARVAAGMEHSNVVRVHEYNPQGPFLVMEYLPGGTLEDRLEGGEPMAPSQVRYVLESVLDGLEAVHRRGVIHRDLKPANVFFGPGGEVKIGDFGVAHLADLGATLTGAMLGTLAYMAPEQMTGSRPPEASTDLYALGVVLFRMLTGRLPFEGGDLLTQQLEATPPAPSEVAPALGAAYDELLASLLAKRPEQRPRSVAELRERLEHLPWPEHLLAVSPTRPSAPSEPPPSVPPPPDERYALLSALPRGGWRARDSVLDRTVCVLSCDAALAERLARLARADGPHLQAVYEIDEDEGRAVVEDPDGTPLAEQELEPARRERMRAQVAAALARLHAEGVVHGAVDARHVVVAPGRAVLLLPDHEPDDASPEDDLAAARGL